MLCDKRLAFYSPYGPFSCLQRLQRIRPAKTAEGDGKNAGGNITDDDEEMARQLAQRLGRDGDGDGEGDDDGVGDGDGGVYGYGDGDGDGEMDVEYEDGEWLGWPGSLVRNSLIAAQEDSRMQARYVLSCRLETRYREVKATKEWAKAARKARKGCKKGRKRKAEASPERDNKRPRQAAIPAPPEWVLANDGNFLERFRSMYGNLGDNPEMTNRGGIEVAGA